MHARTRVRLSGLLGLTMVGALALGLDSAAADETVPPSAQDVAAAREVATRAERTVADVQVELIRAQTRADDAAIAAAQAAEAFNGARWAAGEARRAAQAARHAQREADASAERQRETYGRTVVDTYQNGPELGALTTVVASGGVDELVERTATWRNADQAMTGRYASYRSAVTISKVASDQATRASAEATRLQASAQAARSAAAGAQVAADRQAASLSVRRTELISELARLQGVSVALAGQRQKALEDAAAEAAATANQTETETPQPPAVPVRPTPAPQPSVSPAPAPSAPAPAPAPAPSAPAPSVPTPSVPAPSAPPTVIKPPVAPPVTSPNPPPPAASGGARAAIAFAKRQLGEPYRWGAEGPNAWDCSGLLKKAWAAGGKSLPHWSVGQYTGSTPITVGQLAPGDLVFWGSRKDPSSIYHVAMYIGDGQIIHAPRTGRPVAIDSLYYWRAPNFFARP